MYPVCAANPANVRFNCKMDTDLKILALPLYGIGDVLMATPALKNIKEKLPSSRLTFLHMFKTTRDVLAGNPNVDENIHFPFLAAGKLASAKFIMGLRGEYDVAINFYPSNRRDYNLASFLSGCPVRIGHTYVKHNFREMNFLKNRTLREDDELHNVEENIRLLDFLGIKCPMPYPLEIFLTGAEDEEASRFLAENGIDEKEKTPLIGFHPGTSAFKEHTNKRWPSKKFSELIDSIAELSPHSRFLIFGGPEESGLKNEIKQGCAKGPLVYPVERPGIRQTAAVMKKCRLFISNDSGLMHLAAALRLPTVGIFGPTNQKWVGPWECPSRVVRNSDVHCGPCFRYSPASLACEKKYDFKCLQGITVAQMLEAVKGLVKF